jgi:hypothetical protein
LYLDKLNKFTNDTQKIDRFKNNIKKFAPNDDNDENNED